MSNNSFAVLICIYNGESLKNIKEMFESLYNAEIPIGYTMHIYLHLDGKLDKEKIDYINELNIYKVLESKVNIGLAKGLNKCIESLGDENYYFRMDSDDLCIPDRFIKQIIFMDSNPDIDFSGGSISEFISSPDNIVSIRDYPSIDKDIKEFLVKGSPFAHVTICFRGGFFKRFGVYPVSYPLNEDIALWYNVIKVGAKPSNVKDILVSVRMDNAYSRRTIKKAYFEYRVYMKISWWLGKLPIYPTLRFIFRLCPAFLVKSVYNSSLRKLILK
ncbi:TPA: glycosyltransferase [Photobacterium damselae]